MNFPHIPSVIIPFAALAFVAFALVRGIRQANKNARR